MSAKGRHITLDYTGFTGEGEWMLAVLRSAVSHSRAREVHAHVSQFDGIESPNPPKGVDDSVASENLNSADNRQLEDGGVEFGPSTVIRKRGRPPGAKDKVPRKKRKEKQPFGAEQPCGARRWTRKKAARCKPGSGAFVAPGQWVKTFPLSERYKSVVVHGQRTDTTHPLPERQK